MRRSNLTSFALGAAASLISCYVAYFLHTRQEEPTRPFLIVFAPDIRPIGAEVDDLSSISYDAGNVIRECGVKDFQVKVGDLHGFTYSIEITEDNSAALQCIVSNVRTVDDGIQLGFKVA